MVDGRLRLGKEKTKEKIIMNGFIIFYNSFMESGDKKLTPVEFYFYSLLYARWSPFLNASEVTVSRITEVQTIYIDKNKPTRNKSNVYSHMLKLKKKGLIKITLNGDPIENEKVDYDKTLSISFTDVDGGFEKIFSNLLDKASNHYELFFLCILQRFKDKGFEKKIEGIADLLSCNVKTAKQVIKQLKDNGHIKTDIEKYQDDRGQFTSSPNKYFFEDAANKPVKVVEEKVVVSESEDEPHGGEEKRTHSWYERDNGFPDADDYYVYLTTTDEKLKKYAEKRIKGLSSTTYGKKQVDELLSEAGSMVVREERQRERDEEEKQKNQLIQTMKVSEHNYIKRNGKYIELSNIEELSKSDALLWVKSEQDMSNPTRERFDRLKETPVHIIVTCHSLQDPNHFGYPMIKEETQGLILKKLKEAVTTCKFDESVWSVIDAERDCIITKNNESIPYNQEHEGDLFESYGEGSNENTSLKKRIMRYRNEHRKLQEEKKIEHDKEFIAGLFD